jgi:hypothetical protein
MPPNRSLVVVLDVETVGDDTTRLDEALFIAYNTLISQGNKTLKALFI